MSELLDCPFCGGSADYHKINKKWLVECQQCIVSTSVPTHGKEMAAEYWNRRTPINKDQAIKDSLEQRNDKLRSDDA